MRSSNTEATEEILKELKGLTIEDPPKFVQLLQRILETTFMVRHHELKDQVLAKARMYGMETTVIIDRVLRHIERNQRVEAARVRASVQTVGDSGTDGRIVQLRRRK